jgi:hypothetical protein
MKKWFITVLMLAPLVALTVIAQDSDKAVPVGCPDLVASTIFISDKTGSRQKGSAEQLSDMHKQVQAQGWSYEDMEIYIEDGDLQGFFVTYTKKSSCSQI